MNNEQIAALLTDIRNLLKENVQPTLERLAGAETSSSTTDVLYDTLATIIEHHVTAAVRNQPPTIPS